MRSSEVAAEASGIKVNRSKIMIFALSAAIAGIGGALLGMFSFAFTNTTAPVLPGLIWLALAVTFGIRRPGGALLAGFAFAGGTAVFHWISSWSFLSGGDVQALITSIYFVPILSGLGAIQLAQEPDGILSLAGQQKLAQEAREGTARAHRRGRSGRRTAARCRSTSVHALDRRAAPAADARSPDRLSDADVADAAFAVRGVVAGYGDAEVLHGVDLRRRARQGHRAARRQRRRASRRSARSAAGIVEASTSARCTSKARTSPTREPFRRARAGVLLVPEARGIFPGLTVEENLTVLLRDDQLRKRGLRPLPDPLRSGASRSPACSPAASSRCSASRPRSPTRRSCSSPTSPRSASRRSPRTRSWTRSSSCATAGCAVLLVEEHAQNALRAADTLAFMELGNIVWTGPRDEADMDLLTSAYLGGSA